MRNRIYEFLEEFFDLGFYVFVIFWGVCVLLHFSFYQLHEVRKQRQIACESIGGKYLEKINECVKIKNVNDNEKQT